MICTAITTSPLSEWRRQESRRRKAEKVVLEVRKSNNPAINFYLKFNFKIAGERKNYYSNPVEDAYVMELEISD